MGEGWALEFERFLGPVKWHRADRRVPFGAVLRIRDVYPGSRILNFIHPGSQIQKQQQNREVKKIRCQTVLCSHKI